MSGRGKGWPPAEDTTQWLPSAGRSDTRSPASAEAREDVAAGDVSMVDVARGAAGWAACGAGRATGAELARMTRATPAEVAAAGRYGAAGVRTAGRYGRWAGHVAWPAVQGAKDVGERVLDEATSWAPRPDQLAAEASAGVVRGLQTLVSGRWLGQMSARAARWGRWRLPFE